MTDELKSTPESGLPAPSRPNEGGDGKADPQNQPKPGGQETNPPAPNTANLVIWIIILIIFAGAIIFSLEKIFKETGFKRMEAITICLSAIFTLAILSFLYKENPIYRMGEYIIVGIGLGYGLSRAINSNIVPNWWNVMVGANDSVANWWWLLVIPFGLLWYFQLSKKYIWLSQLLMAFFIGSGVGMQFRATFNLLLQEEKGQIPDSIRSVAITHWDTFSVWDGASNLIFLGICLCVLSYFFFSFRHEKYPVLKYSSKMGRIFLMVAFGAIFGTTIQGRLSLFIDRLRLLVETWIKGQ